MTRFALAGSLSPSSLPKTVGTICHDTPYLSWSQPHWSFRPPAESLSHSSSTSFCVSQFTNKEIAGVNLNCGPPFRVLKSCHLSWYVAHMNFTLFTGHCCS